MSQDLCPLGGDSEEKGDYTAGHQPWGVSGLSQILDAPVLGSYTGKTSTLGRLENSKTNRRALGSLDLTCKECTLTRFLPKQGRERSAVVAVSCPPLPWFAPYPELSEDSSPTTQSKSQCNTGS